MIVALQKRVDVFMEFMESGRLDKVAVDAEQSEQLIKLLDAAVIRLEGGSDLDLTILDEVPGKLITLLIYKTLLICKKQLQLGVSYHLTFFFCMFV